MDHIYRANAAALLRLIETAFSTPQSRVECHEIDGAIITSYIETRRSGLPDDAVCVRYHFETPEWEMEARATWWLGRIYRGRGVHCEIVTYAHPDGNARISKEKIAELVNDWFCGCSAI